MIGKTKQDMLSGAKLRNYHNKRLRAEWSRASKERPKGGRVEIDFPVQTCNGKKTRALVE